MEEKQYFEKINEYYVKDGEAREDIETLNNTIGDNSSGLIKRINDLENNIATLTNYLNNENVIGKIMMWGSDTIPTGWLLCDGSAVSRSEYSELLSVIGLNFGYGDGINTFNLPDLRGRVSIGKSSESEFDNIGEMGGEKIHKHRTQVAIDGTENEKYIYGFLGDDGLPVYGSEVIQSAKRGTITPVTIEDGEPVRVSYTDNGNSIQPYTVLNYIIKAKRTSLS